jgi:hypothetical protein
LAQAPSGLQNISSPQEGGNCPDLINASFSPEDVRPFPRAEPRNVSNRGKNKRKAAILTGTPEKRITEEEKKLREENKSKKPTVQKQMDLESTKITRHEE